MIKKSVIIAIIFVITFLFVSCSGFNLWKPKNIEELIQNLPPEQKVSTAQGALSTAEDDDSKIEIGESLADQFSDELSDGVAENATEAEAAEVIATAYIQASPVGDLISTITEVQTEGGELDIESILTNIMNDPEKQENLVMGLLNGATYTNIAADYNIESEDETNVDLQVTNAILNLGAAIIYEAGIEVDDQNENGTVDTVTIEDTDTVQEQIENVIENAFQDTDNDGSPDGIQLQNEDAQEALEDAKDSLEAIINNIDNPDDPVFQLADTILNLLPESSQ